MKLASLLLLLLFFYVVPTRAEVCTHHYTPHHLYEEAKKRNIHLELKELDIKSLDGHLIDANKIYNPEFEHFTTSGNQFGQRNVTSESRIWFNLQLNNKRAKRANVVEAEKAIGQVELDLLRLKLKQEIFLAILRYKQIQRELGAVNKINDAIEKFVNRYRSIGFLTHEQKVEVGALELSERDLELRISSLENESDLILRFFQKMTGETCDVKVKLSDNLGPNEWPDLDQFEYRPDQSLNFKLDQLVLKKSQFEFDREESKKVPDLKVGPVWQLNKLGAKEFNIFGVCLIMPLPFSDRNQGMRVASEYQLKRKQREEDYRRNQREREFDFRKDSYLRLRAKMEGRNDIQYDKLVSQYQSLFNRGLISTPSFLNYKRELLNLTLEVHQIENALASHLLELYRLNDHSSDDFLTKVLKL